MVAARQDFVIEKGARFYKEIQLTDDAGTPVTLVGKKIKFTAKESTATSTKLHDLTEDNSGIQVLDDALGNVAIYISAEDTGAIEADYGWYNITEIDEDYPDEEIERLLEGKITYSKGV